MKTNVWGGSGAWEQENMKIRLGFLAFLKESEINENHYPYNNPELVPAPVMQIRIRQHVLANTPCKFAWRIAPCWRIRLANDRLQGEFAWRIKFRLANFPKFAWRIRLTNSQGGGRF